MMPTILVPIVAAGLLGLPTGLAVAPQDAAATSAPDEATPLDSRIVEVTVFGSTASVRRRASLSAGGGVFALRGLPFGLDPDSVRVRCEGGEVVGVEVRDRFQKDVPDARVQELRQRVRGLERELSVLEDDADLLRLLQEHVRRLLLLEEETHQRELREGRVAPDVWEANFAYLRGKLEALGGEGRELQDRIEEKRLQLADARLELGRFEGTGGVRLRDVVVDVITSGTGAASLEVEYVVGNAGWQPYYDLRARKDLSVVELAYRAKVWQRSGEDWREAAILLSTAQPQRGAQGPEPRPVWLSLLDPSTARMTGARRRSMSDVVGIDSDAAPEKSMPAEPPPFAAVQSEGLSVRFRLPRTETIESRDQPTTVLIGRADLVVTPEHYCVPALDPTVWLRARTVNTSDWVMLPGRAAVYFGADYLGHAWLEAVQLEQDFTVHLGPDPGLVVERTQIEDLKEGSGLFSSKESLRESWRIRVENHGAYSNRADGAVDVIVHESLPRPRDDRIEVTIDKVRPRPREDERWKKEREEKGILTWILRVRRGGELTIELTTEIGYPESMSLVRH